MDASALPGDIVFSGVFRHLAFRFNCSSSSSPNVPAIKHSSSTTGRTLELTFGANASTGDFYGDGYGQGLQNSAWLLNAVIVTAGESAPTAEGRCDMIEFFLLVTPSSSWQNDDFAKTGSGHTHQASQRDLKGGCFTVCYCRAYLALTESLAASQLVDWMIIGPFLDDHFTARDHTLGPERSIGSTIDYSKKFDNGQGQMLRWQALQAERSVAAPVAMRMPPAVAAASRNRTVAAVLCTHLQVPAAAAAAAGADARSSTADGLIAVGGAGGAGVEVLLRGSTSALAEISIDNQTVLTDRLITGLLLEEFSQRVTLPTGASEKPPFAMVMPFS